MTTFDHEQALNDLMTLLAIPGKSGEERRIMDHLKEVLGTLGVEPEAIVEDDAFTRSPIGGNAGNLYVHMNGTGKENRLLLTAHVDTVPLADGAIPRLDRDTGKIVNDAEGHALGADDRTGCAALLQAIRHLAAKQGDHAPVTFIFLVQEEIGLVGAKEINMPLLGSPVPCMGFNIDGSSPRNVLNAIIGAERLVIDIDGKGTHAGMCPEGGISAAIIAAKALAELARAGWHGLIERPEGKGSANAGSLAGGEASNTVMPHVHILAEARSHDPVFRATILTAWREAFTRAAQEETNVEGGCGKVHFAQGPTYEAFSVPLDSPVVQSMNLAASACGWTAAYHSSNGGADANWLVAHGIPVLTFGAGMRDVHSAAETADISEFLEACQLTIALAEQAGCHA